MTYGIITTGSRGDVQPFVALALALLNRGHQVTIVTNENFREFVTSFGVPFLPITGDTEATINSPQALRLLEGGNVFKFIYHLLKIGEKDAPQQNRDILHACENFDYLITSVLPLSIVYSIAEKQKKRCALVFLSLPPIPTREFPYEAIGFKLPSWLNKFSYRMLHVAYNMSSKQIDGFRQEIGLPRKNVLKAMLRRDTDLLAILAESTEIVKRPTDWPRTAYVTGFFYLPPAARAKYAPDAPPEGLEEFINAGEPPVYIGFGSIPIPNHEQFYQALQGVLTRKRVVLSKGWSVLDRLPSHPNLFVAKYFDHDKLLPRCSVAVIHGGIGTVAAVLKSGIPLIIVSILADQPINGKLIQKRGLGFHIPFKQLNAQNLVQAIDATQTPTIRENCRTTAAKIREEAGIETAAHLIEQDAARSH